MHALIPFLEQFALSSLEKQDKLLQLVGEHALELDLERGSAVFSETVTIPFQVLGTESDNTLTWLWAWADEHAELPDGLLRSSREMKNWLERKGLEALALPSLDLETADGFALSLIATEVCGADAFYRDAYEGGSVWLLLFGGDIDRQAAFDRTRLARCLDDLAGRYDIDPRKALGAYVRKRRLIFDERSDLMNILLENGQRFIVEFEAGGRIKTMNGEPSQAPEDH